MRIYQRGGQERELGDSRCTGSLERRTQLLPTILSLDSVHIRMQRSVIISVLLLALSNRVSLAAKEHTPQSTNYWQGRTLFSWLWRKARAPSRKDKQEMGQGMRLMTYDRAANERAAIPALKVSGSNLRWFRLDDGVMGGQSESLHEAVDVEDDSSSQKLHFKGTINTSGGGFASVRANLTAGLLTSSTSGMIIRIKGDGKTYKFLLSEGNRNAGSPISRLPTWQIDLPTQVSGDNDEWQEVVVPFDKLAPSWGGRAQSRPSEEEKLKHKFDPTSMREVGIMLSLYRSNGEPNPKETFGEGIFPFSLHVQSLEPVTSDTCSSDN
jgi:hypothetical protein